MKRTVAALTAVAGIAGFANAQFIEIVPSQVEVDVTGGAQTIGFSMFFDSEGVSEIDLGGAVGVVGFFGWAGLNGTFNATAGNFEVRSETNDDAFGGDVVAFGQPAIIDPTSWFGRRPGAAAVNGSDAFVPAFNITATVNGSDGNGGSFRFSNVAPNYEVRNGGLQLGFAGGANISGAQKPTAAGGSGQDTSARIEVFRGEITFDNSDLGSQSISFAGLASFFIEQGLTGFTSVGFDQIGGEVRVFEIPTPASIALLGLGGIAARRRR